MEQQQNKFITLNYQLYQVENDEKKLLEQTSPQHPFQLISGFGTTLDALEQQFGNGWTRETGVPILVTSGMGCEGVNLRLNTQAEVWLITLTARPTA